MKLSSVFTCGRRPAGHVMMSVVGVVGVVVVGGGGYNFYTWVLPEPMYGLVKFKRKTLYFIFYFKSPCLDQMPMYGVKEDEGGSLFILNL